MNSKTTFFILGLLTFVAVTVNAQTFQWANKGSGSSRDYGKAIATDNAGNIYVTGLFSQSAIFNGITVNGYGSNDVFLAKYRPDGSLIWIKKAGSIYGDEVYGIAVDRNCNIFITGEIQIGSSVVTFDSLSITDVDMFIAKYDSSGKIQWVKGVNNAFNSYGASTDYLGNCYITGGFSGTATFGSNSITSTGDVDVFVAKYSFSGNEEWVKKGGSLRSDQGYAITTDSTGNTYVTGTFDSAAVFGSFNLTSYRGFDFFITKYDPDGNVIWAKGIGGGGSDYGYGIALNKSGTNCYVTGAFDSTVAFGSTNLIAAGIRDIFISKLDSSGNHTWANKAGGSSSDYGYAVTCDNDENIYITGNYSSIANFDTVQITGTHLYIAKYNSSGSVKWAKKAGGTYSDEGRGIATDNNGNIYFTGHYNGNILFDQIQLTGGGGTNTDIFIAKINDFLTSGTITGSPFCEGMTVNVPFTVNTIFNPGNIFTAQLSNASGSFASPVNIGTLTGTTSGTINATIPPGTVTGSAYRIRVIASDPQIIGSDNGANLVINAFPAATITPAGPTTFCQSGSVKLNANTGGLTYQWLLNGANITGATSSSYTATQAGDYTVIVTKSAGCTTTSSATTVTTIPLPTASISAFGPITFCLSGSVQLIANTGSNLTYQWKRNNTNIPGEVDSTYITSTAGSYSVYITDTITKCGNTSNAISVTTLSPAADNICIVTVDSTKGKNKIVWEKLSGAQNISRYIIYKETTSAGVYAKLDSVPYNQLCEYLDTTSQPEVLAARYKISVKDTCNNESPISSHHKTIHLTINKGTGNSWNLIWDNYEGFSFSTFDIYRGTKPDSLYYLTSLASNLFSYTDNTAPVGDIYYFVAVNSPAPCASFKMATTYSKSKSNLSTSIGAPSFVQSNYNTIFNVALYPNPSNGFTRITAETSVRSDIITIKITNILGMVVYENQLTTRINSFVQDTDLSSLPPGAYHLILIGSGGQTAVKKFIRE